jgi:ribosome assembly protein YihI (activator of Der GTPase)
MWNKDQTQTMVNHKLAREENMKQAESRFGLSHTCINQIAGEDNKQNKNRGIKKGRRASHGSTRIGHSINPT